MWEGPNVFARKIGKDPNLYLYNQSKLLKVTQSTSRAKMASNWKFLPKFIEGEKKKKPNAGEAMKSKIWGAGESAPGEWDVLNLGFSVSEKGRCS